MFKKILIILNAIAALFALLFCIYFFNLDMKLIVNVIAPVFEEHYDKRERKQYV